MITKPTLHLGIALFAGALVLAPVSPARADMKTISASECQPFLPTTYSQALFNDNAIYNPTATNQRVICPVNQDASVRWTSGNVELQAAFKAGAAPGKVSCTLYGGGTSWYGAPQVAYTVTSPVVLAGEIAFLDFGNVISGPVGGDSQVHTWNILCTLNPGMSLNGFFINENYDTGL